MKLKFFTTLCLMMLTLSCLRSQVLFLEALTTDSTGRSMSGVSFELRSSCKLVASGNGPRVKMCLNANEVYTVTFSKPGYQSKVIVVSTFSGFQRSFHFDFYISLRRERDSDTTEPMFTAGSIYFDKKSDDYAFQVYKDHSLKTKGMLAEQAKL